MLWEIAKLSELGRIEIDLKYPELARTLARIQTWPLTLDSCRSIKSLDFDSDPVVYPSSRELNTVRRSGRFFTAR